MSNYDIKNDNHVPVFDLIFTLKKNNYSKLLKNLAQYPNHEVRNIFYKNLQLLWEIKPKIIWACINITKKKKTSIKKIKHIDGTTMKYIDLNILESIIFVIPKIKKTIKQKDNDRLIILLDELLDVIINMHIVEHKQYSDYYGYSYMRHYPMFFNILAYYTSYKKNIAIDFKKKIFSNWHRFPLMLEEFLKQFILVNLDNSDTTSSYNMWKLYCVEIIKDADVYDDNDEYIIKLLIFDDLTIQNKWNSNLDIWLINHIPIIEKLVCKIW